MKVIVPLLTLTYSASFVILLCVTMSRYPLLKWSTRDIEWTRAWLYTTIADYYGLALVLSVIFFHLEPFWIAFLLTCGVCVFGSRIGTIWIAFRLLEGRGLKRSV